MNSFEEIRICGTNVIIRYGRVGDVCGENVDKSTEFAGSGGDPRSGRGFCNGGVDVDLFAGDGDRSITLFFRDKDNRLTQYVFTKVYVTILVFAS